MACFITLKKSTVAIYIYSYIGRRQLVTLCSICEWFVECVRLLGTPLESPQQSCNLVVGLRNWNCMFGATHFLLQLSVRVVTMAKQKVDIHCCKSPLIDEDRTVAVSKPYNIMLCMGGGDGRGTEATKFVVRRMPGRARWRRQRHSTNVSEPQIRGQYEILIKKFKWKHIFILCDCCIVKLSRRLQGQKFAFGQTYVYAGKYRFMHALGL